MKNKKGIEVEEPRVREPEGTYPLSTFNGVGKFRSIWRAIRRGNASPAGYVYPNRPFSNSKVTRGRVENENRKRIYDQLKLKGISGAN